MVLLFDLCYTEQQNGFVVMMERQRRLPVGTAVVMRQKEGKTMPILIGLGVLIVLVVGYIALYNQLRRLEVKVEEGSSGIDVALEKRYDMLSEQMEAVKKFLNHEKEVYLSVTAVRSGTDLEKAMLEEKTALSKEAIQTIDETIQAQQEQMERLKKQLQKQHPSKKQKQKREGQAEAYEMAQAEQKMNVNQKINLLASVQQGLSGVGSAIDALSEQYPVLYSYVSMDQFQKAIFDVEEHLQAARRLYNSNVSLYNQKIVMFPYSILAGIHGMKKADFYEAEEKKKTYQVNF